MCYQLESNDMFAIRFSFISVSFHFPIIPFSKESEDVRRKIITYSVGGKFPENSYELVCSFVLYLNFVSSHTKTKELLNKKQELPMRLQASSRSLLTAGRQEPLRRWGQRRKWKKE